VAYDFSHITAAQLTFKISRGDLHCSIMNSASSVFSNAYACKPLLYWPSTNGVVALLAERPAEEPQTLNMDTIYNI